MIKWKKTCCTTALVATSLGSIMVFSVLLSSDVVKRSASVILLSVAAAQRDRPQLKQRLEDGSGPGACKPKMDMVFFKTHKTGSSTVQNILFRHALRHNLTIAFPLEETWMFDQTRPFEAPMVHGFKTEHSKFNLYLFHSVWNAREVRKVVPDGLAVTILRNPVDAFESSWTYFKFKPSDINLFVEDTKRQLQSKLNSKANTMTISRPYSMLWDLGIQKMSTSHPDHVNRSLEQLDKQFDFVMITELFDESLVLLQDMMCWPPEAVTYLKLNTRSDEAKEQVNAATEATRATLKDWLWADFVLYDHFSRKLERRMEEYGIERLKDQVIELRHRNQVLKVRCKAELVSDRSRLPRVFRPAIDTVDGVKVDRKRPECVPYAVTEMAFSRLLRSKQENPWFWSDQSVL